MVLHYSDLMYDSTGFCFFILVSYKIWLFLPSVHRFLFSEQHNHRIKVVIIFIDSIILVFYTAESLLQQNYNK